MVYRCGNVYSDIPCGSGAHARTLDVSDERSVTDKATADRRTQSINRVNQAMERDRESREAVLVREARGARSARATKAHGSTHNKKDAHSVEHHSKTNGQKKEMEYFTAISPRPVKK